MWSANVTKKEKKEDETQGRDDDDDEMRAIREVEWRRNEGISHVIKPW